MAEISGPVERMDRGVYAHQGHKQLRQISENIARPRNVQQGGSTRAGDSTHCGHDSHVNLRLGNSVRGHTDFKTVVSEQMAHKPLGTEGDVLSSNGFFAASGSVTC